MTTQNFKLLGNNDTIRTRRFRVLQLYLKGAIPPEIAYTMGLETKQVYNDINFLRSIQLNDLPIEIIRDMGANFFEMKIRELQARIAQEADKEKKDKAYILGLEKLILSHKIESLKVQGAYEDPEDKRPGPIQIIFEEVSGRHGKDSAKLTEAGQEEEGSGGEDHDKKEAAVGLHNPAQDPEKEYPRY